MKKQLIAILLLLPLQFILAQDLKNKVLKLTEAKNEYVNGAAEDWMLEKESIPSKVFRNGDKDLILSNGLISRTFRITPNVATTSFKKLYNQEELIRAVKPEAIITINDFVINVGGLEGQSNLAFLIPEWIDSLKINPLSFQLQDFKISDIEKRTEWKRSTYDKSEVEWPPKGVHLKMTYALNRAVSAEEILKISQESSTGRLELLSDDFKTLSKEWKITTSDSHERSSFSNEGKIGEIYTPKNTAVFAEQKLPEGVRVVETVVDAGTDHSGRWAPGIGLLWKEKIVKFTIQNGTEAGDAARPFKFIVFDGKREIMEAGGFLNYSFDKPWTLRLRIEGNQIHCEAKPQAGIWKLIHTIKSESEIDDPLSVRLGKLGRNAEGVDYSDPGKIVRLTMHSFTAYSEVKKDLLKKLDDNLKSLKQVTVAVNYEMYDGIPVLSKWVEIFNNSDESIKVDNIVSEYLALTDLDPTNKNFGRPDLAITPNVHLETDYAFGAQKSKVSNSNGVHWSSDQSYETQISIARDIPNQVKTYPMYGYHVFVEGNASMESIRTFVLPYDTFDKERQGLALRKMYRVVAPWVTDNPMTFHLTRNRWDEFENAVKQSVELGYEMINFSFGSGFNAENTSDKNYALIDKYVAYAKERGISLGTYNLLASRRISEKDDVINPATGKPGGIAYFGNSPCLESEWGNEYFRKMRKLFDGDHLLSFTHDGSYPGDVCASTDHPGHINLEDSQYKQWKKISDFYKDARANGVHLRVPDYYYLSGQSQSVIGYREANWSLPRRQQLIHTRQHIFDGTWESTPAMRWSFIPLTQYHGGGAAATIEPLNEHLDHYEMMLACNLGMGIQSVLRGPRLYDTESTKTMVKRMTDWYRKYRGILESDILHLKKADGRGIDYMMHVNPKLKEKGMFMVYNPTDKTIKKTVKVPLYYTGLTDVAKVKEQGGKVKTYYLDRKYFIEMEVEVKANWYNWYVIE